MAREFRTPAGDLLNFLGGKWTRRAQSAVGVAAAKADVASGGKLARETVARLERSVLVQFCPHSNGRQRLEWIPLTDLRNGAFVRAELLEDLQSPSSGDILANLPKLLASMEPPPPPVAPSRTDAQKHDFDVVAAIKASAAAARPENREFQGGRQGKWPQQLSDIARCVGAIPKIDLRKLRLRFHPDKLQVQLCREPSDEERTLAGIAMRLLNEAVQASSSVLNSVNELDGIIRRYLSGIASQPVHNPADKVAEFLSQMRMSPA
ncbi:hypothetical protein FOA52_000138 [Chlamydomonas sp. UWO 241]|nr:hypothetical protein FOA52_000138 [Chlamydomonas sp. UWO 241]